MIYEGNVWRYKSDVDTDVIIPARYLNTSNPKELAKHCMEDIDQSFAKDVQSGDIIVAEDNFGCGSSREHAPIALKASGVSCIIANSFARIFYRNSINIGLPILESKEAVKNTHKGDRLSININTGEIYNKTKNEKYQANGFPEFMQKLIKSGGLVNYANKYWR